MKWIQQSVVLFRAQPRQSLYLSVFALGVLLAGSCLGLVGVWLASVGMIYLQAWLFRVMTGHELKFYQLGKIPGARSLLLLSLVMVPTHMMMGTMVGLLQEGGFSATSFLLIAVFSLICGYAYILISHAVGFIVLRGLSFRWALDASLKGMGKNKKPLLTLGLLLILILGIGALPVGLGLVFAMPVVFYSCYYSFRELYLEPAPNPSAAPSL